jgi:hypothetical protein
MDPMVFYVISVLSNLSFIFGYLTLLIIISAVIISIISIAAIIDDCFDVIAEGFSKIKKRFILIPIVTIVLLSIFIPSEETMTKMLVASQLNEQNYTMAKEEIIELIDYILEKIDN